MIIGSKHSTPKADEERPPGQMRDHTARAILIRALETLEELLILSTRPQVDVETAKKRIEHLHGVLATLRRELGE